MTPAIATSTPAGALYRVGRAPDAWAWPDWAFAGDDGTFGNRYDDPAGDYRVLYAGSHRVGAYVEVLARYRTDPALVAEYEQIEDDGERPTIPPGIVPADWPEHRHIGTAYHPGRFADVGHSTRWRTSASPLQHASCTTASTTSTAASFGGAHRAR